MYVVCHNTPNSFSFIISYTQYLDELNATPRNDFTIGEMTAYVETLEILQRWEKANLYGLDFIIEDKYKI